MQSSVGWYLENDLLLTGNKSDILVSGAAAPAVEVRRSVAAVNALAVAGTSLPLSPEVKSLGNILHDRLRFDSHARAVAQACTFDTLALRHILPSELATRKP